jgi:UDP-N-acetylmuramoyl-tripeptide--D-alanyl-D-alanine ligase
VSSGDWAYTLAAVGRRSIQEELIPVGYASEALINADLVARRFLKKVEKSVLHLYGRGQKYSFDGKNYILNGKVVQKDASKLIGAGGEAATTAALAAGELMGLSEKELRLAATSLDAEHGRMSLLKGKGGSLLIDDTYNSSPEALRSAIQYLYQQPQKRKIALLGMMNEMGSMSEQAHREAGRLCDPKRLELIVTLGRDANSHLADEAEKMGCSVIRTDSPTEAADIAMHYLSPNTVVLLKGSQNGVYLEEATKRLLANQSDSAKLVRQHSYWPAKKAKQFSDLKS